MARLTFSEDDEQRIALLQAECRNRFADHIGAFRLMGDPQAADKLEAFLSLYVDSATRWSLAQDALTSAVEQRAGIEASRKFLERSMDAFCGITGDCATHAGLIELANSYVPDGNLVSPVDQLGPVWDFLDSDFYPWVDEQVANIETKGAS
jgi:hypothetical protein